MPKYQQFINDRTSLVCDKPECQTRIEIGEMTVKELRPRVFGGDKFYHWKCRPDKARVRE
jgi:hypothetical protein